MSWSRRNALFGLASMALGCKAVAWSSGPPPDDPVAPIDDAGEPSEPVGGETTTVYVVRHAEKQTGPDAGSDPELTDAGKARAAALAGAIPIPDVAQILSTDLRRTQQTAADLAAATGLTVDTMEAQDFDAIKAAVRAHAGRAVVVVGHSNTVPGILEALGVDDTIELADGDYGDLFVVTVTDAGASLERRRFDPPASEGAGTS